MTRAFPFILTLLACAALSCSDNGGPGSDGNGSAPTGEFVVLAWNDLGMHCLNDTYDQAVILPPYNTVWAQIVERGDPPRVVTSGLTVEFRLELNTYSYGKRTYGQFWDTFPEVFGPLTGMGTLQRDIGLTGTGLSGEMEPAVDHFVAEGIPVVPVYDSGTWDPYQTVVLVVRNSAGEEVASTRATVPVSDEMNCSLCHKPDPWSDAVADHDRLHGTSIVDSMPLLCASCHGSPVLGTSGPGSSGHYLSEAIHDAHSTRGATCYDCHPGPVTLCSRSSEHTAADGNCQACHGSISQVASTIEGGRVPWLDEPQCSGCHSGIPGVDTGDVLYRNASGHGGLYCAACHHSPHAMYPSDLAQDNHQPLQYQGFTGRVKTIGSCGVCHEDSRGETGEFHEFAEEHGGASPEQVTACHVCHTSVGTETSNWPHGHQWTDSNSP